MNIHAVMSAYTPVKLSNSKSENNVKTSHNATSSSVSFGKMSKEDWEYLIFGDAFATPGDDYGADSGCFPYLVIGVLGILGIGAAAIMGGCEGKAKAEARARAAQYIEYRTNQQPQENAELLNIIETPENEAGYTICPNCGNNH